MVLCMWVCHSLLYKQWAVADHCFQSRSVYRTEERVLPTVTDKLLIVFKCISILNIVLRIRSYTSLIYFESHKRKSFSTTLSHWKAIFIFCFNRVKIQFKNIIDSSIFLLCLIAGFFGKWTDAWYSDLKKQ